MFRLAAALALALVSPASAEQMTVTGPLLAERPLDVLAAPEFRAARAAALTVTFTARTVRVMSARPHRAVPRRGDGDWIAAGSRSGRVCLSTQRRPYPIFCGRA